MRGRPSVLWITLTPQEQRILAQYQRSSILPWGLVRRGRCVLLRAQGHSITAIAARVGMQRTNVARWLRRFQTDGLGGLQDKEGRGRRPR